MTKVYVKALLSAECDGFYLVFTPKRNAFQ